jgi:hypothetical protein
MIIILPLSSLLNCSNTFRGFLLSFWAKGFKVLNNSITLFHDLGIVMMQLYKNMLRVSLTRYTITNKTLNKGLFFIDVNT